jgi:hypothetical protein
MSRELLWVSAAELNMLVEIKDCILSKWAAW